MIAQSILCAATSWGDKDNLRGFLAQQRGRLRTGKTRVGWEGFRSTLEPMGPTGISLKTSICKAFWKLLAADIVSIHNYTILYVDKRCLIHTPVNSLEVLGVEFYRYDSALQIAGSPMSKFCCNITTTVNNRHLGWKLYHEGEEFRLQKSLLGWLVAGDSACQRLKPLNTFTTN